MAVFGLPGGAEWAIIALVVVFLFVPGALVFWLGYLTGKGAANPQSAAPTAVGSTAPVTPAERWQMPNGAPSPVAPGSAGVRRTSVGDGTPQHDSEEGGHYEHEPDVALTWDSRAGRSDD